MNATQIAPKLAKMISRKYRIKISQKWLFEAIKTIESSDKRIKKAARKFNAKNQIFFENNGIEIQNLHNQGHGSRAIFSILSKIHKKNTPSYSTISRFLKELEG